MYTGYNNLNSVLLDGTIPAVTDPQYGFVTNPASYRMDHDNDGIQGRMVKFDRAAVIAYLNTYDLDSNSGNRKSVELSVTGTVAGTPFECCDTVRVLKQKR